jgi:hypothetical protein
MTVVPEQRLLEPADEGRRHKSRLASPGDRNVEPTSVIELAEAIVEDDWSAFP